jgi:membrane associated rhomboid family serine protease
MAFLYVFGNTLEDMFGARKMATAFFLGGACSFIFSIPFYGIDVSMIGASAAIFTLTAAAMLTKPLKFSWLFLMPLGLVAALNFLYNMLAVYYAVPGNVGYVAHIMGFIIGLPFGVAWNPKRWVKNLFIAILLLLLYVILMSTFSYLLT